MRDPLKTMEFFNSDGITLLHTHELGELSALNSIFNSI